MTGKYMAYVGSYSYTGKASRIFAVLQYILESKEASSCMIEYAIQYHTDPRFMQCVTDFLEVVVVSQADVNFPVISGVVAVGVRFKQRGKIDGIDA